MTVVVDASVAIKWVVEEDDSDAAARLVLDEPLAAPDFLIVECANVLWRKARRRELAANDAIAALAALQGIPIQLFAASDYAASTQALALELDRTVYDCLYLAIALAERAVLVTADRAFVQGIARHGVHSHGVRLLGSA